MSIFKKIFSVTAVFLGCNISSGFAAPGAQDRTFGQDGFYSLPPDPVRGGKEVVSSFSVDAIGRVMLLGKNTTVTAYAPRIDPPTLFVRLLSTGAPDPGFAGTGVERLSATGNDYLLGLSAFPIDGGKSLMLQTRGQYCSTGPDCYSVGTGGVSGAYIEAQRFNIDGSLDAGYAGLSPRLLSLPDSNPVILAAPDGALIVFGSFGARLAGDTVAPFPIYRFDRDGRFDTTFRPDFATLFTCQGGASAGRLAAAVRQTDGKILVSVSVNLPETSAVCVKRINTDGTLDASLSAAETVPIKGLPRFNRLLALPDGGSALVYDTESLSTATPSNVVWFDAAGKLNKKKGTAGVTELPFIAVGGTSPSSPTFALPVSIVDDAAVQSNGKVVLVGYQIQDVVALARADRNRPRAIRLDAQGAFDPTFGEGGSGYVSLAPNSTQNFFSQRKVVISGDGDIFIASEQATSQQPTGQITVLKLEGDPTPKLLGNAVMIPAKPTSFDNIKLSLPGRTCGGRTPYRFAPYGLIKMDKNDLTVSIGIPADDPTPSLPCPLTERDEIDIGVLPAGNYTLTVLTTIALGESALLPGSPSKVPFTVSDSRAQKAAPFVLLNYSGLWWDPNDPGWGLFIWQDKNDNMLAAWFTFSPDGKQIWNVFQPKWDTYYTTFDADLLQAKRMPGMTSPPSTAGSNTVIGKARLEFSRCCDSSNSGAIIYRYALPDGNYGLTEQVRGIVRFKP